MAKPLKVNSAICPLCSRRVSLDEEGSYAQHILYGDKIPCGQTANSVCNGTGLKASRIALREERKRVRVLDAVARRHEEMQRLRKQLEPEVEKLQCGQSIYAEAFCGLLKAYGLWGTIPPRRKGTIKDRLKCLQYDGTFITIILHGKGNSKGIMPLAEGLLSIVTRSII